MDSILSNIIAWIASVLFAYVTNKIYVFSSKAADIKTVARELISFVGCRLLSGFMDISIMYIFVKLLTLNDFIVKIIDNIFVIVVNYVFSKFIVFKKIRLNDKCL